MSDGLSPTGGRSVAGQVGHGHVALAGLRLANAHVHPGPTAFIGRARVGIQKEARHVPVRVHVKDFEKAHVRMPHLRVTVGGLDANVEEAFKETEHAVQDRRQGKVGAGLLFRQIEFGLFEALAPVGNVPRHQLFQVLVLLTALFLGECRNLGEFLLGGRQSLVANQIGQFARPRRWTVPSFSTATVRRSCGIPAFAPFRV